MVTGPATYQATYSTTDAKYTVTWDTNGGIFYWDNPASTKGEVAYGTVITAPDENEVKREGGEGNDKPVYTFLGWSTEREGGEIITDFGTVTKDVTYYAQWKVETKKFMVTWYYGGAGSILQKEQMVAYGEMPVYPGNTPTKAEDQNYFYDFVGWDKEVVPVTGPTSYTATFTAVPAVYVTWQNWDSTILETDKVRQGAAVPTYDGAEPSRAEDAQFTYTFRGWAPDTNNYSAVNENITFVAQFDTTLRSYTVTWKNWDGSVLETDTVEYGTTPVYNSAPPTKAETEEYRYDFAGWDATPVAVTGDVTYTATFDPIWQGGSIYNVWVGGVQVTEGNKSDILGDQDGDAITASYDDTTKTLMLNNFTYEDAGIGYDNGNAVIRTSYNELNIVLEGENVIRNTASGGYGILMGTNWANISGPGKLVVYGNNAAIRASVYIREYADVIISGETRAVDGTLTVTRTERTVNGYTSTTPDSTPTVLGQPNEANVSSYKCIESFETYTITWNSETSTEKATLRYGTPIEAPEASAVKVVDSTFGWDKVVKQIGWNTSNGASTALKEFGVVSGNVTYYPVWSEPVYHYNMYIGDIRVTSENADNILVNGTASYNAETNTLTLNNFNYVGKVTNANGYYDNIFAVLYLQTAADGDLTINLIGENVITNTTTVTNDGQLAAGIYAYASNASLIFTGTGTLTVTGGNGSTNVKTNSAGIVTATANNTYGETASTGLKVMDDCTITAIGGSAYNSYGMKAGIFKMYAGELDLVGGTCKNNEGESLGMSFSGIEELAKRDDCQKYQLIARSENGIASQNQLRTTFNVDLYGDATLITPEQGTSWIKLSDYKHVKLTWKQSS